MRPRTLFLLTAFSITLSLFVIPKAVRAELVVGGVGMTVAQLYDPTDEDPRGHLVVLDVFRASPAERYGVQAGDIILRIADKDTEHAELDELLNKHLRGKEGEDVTLLLWRTGSRSKIEVTITRTLIAY